jgi:ATP adenylyltransferase
MEYLWTPWRSTYMKASREKTACIFCAAVSSSADKETLVVFRARHSFVILNRYPYTSGHLMLAPYEHVPSLTAAPRDAIVEISELMRHAELVISEAYKPDGINLGMNLGRAGGAGIAEHIHMHMLPRWIGDANFMTSVADTRIIPETLEETYSKIKTGFDRLKTNTQGFDRLTS